MKVGDPVEVYRFDDPYGVIVETRKSKYALDPDWCIKFPDGHTEWHTHKLAVHDASAPVPSLADDLAAMTAGNPSWSALRRIAASHEDVALEAILSRAGDWPSILEALRACAHPDVITRAAERVDAWLATDDLADRIRALSTVQGLATRRLAGWEARLLRLEAVVDENLRAEVMAARMMVPGASGDELAAIAGTPAAKTVIYALVRFCPAAAGDVLVPLLRDGTDAVREKIAFEISSVGRQFVGGRMQDAPPLSPAWFELGLELQTRGAPTTLAGYTKTFLAAEHPDRAGVIERFLAANPGSRKDLLDKNPLLTFDAATIARLDLQNAFEGSGGNWLLRSRNLSIEQLDEARPLLASLNPSLHFFADKHLLAWPGLASFTRISLTDQKLGKTGIDRFLKSKHIAQVEELNLSASDIGPLGVKSLAASNAMPKLRDLALDVGDYDDKNYEDDAVAALVSGKGASLRSVTSLSLAGWKPRSLVPLATSALGKQLRSLSLRSHSSLGPGVKEFLHALAENGGVLEEIDLTFVFRNYTDGSDDWNHDGPNRVTPLPSLRSICLDGCGLNTARVKALTEAWFWPQLEHLSLGWPHHQLAPIEHAKPGLKSMSLRFNSDVDDDALARMVAWPVFRSLAKLDVRNTKVTHAPSGFGAALVL